MIARLDFLLFLNEPSLFGYYWDNDGYGCCVFLPKDLK